MGTAALLGSLGGGLISGLGSLFGAGSVGKAANTANQGLSSWLNQMTSNAQPYTAAGSSAIGSLENQLQSGTGVGAQFNLNDFMNGPAYQFALQQGTNAINNSAASQGGLLSGAASKNLAQYSSGLAQQDYNQAYQNYLQNRELGTNQLLGVAGLGQNSATNLNNAGTQIAGLQSGNTMAAGGARAAGTAGLFNGMGSGLSNLGQMYSLKSILGNGGGMNLGNFNSAVSLGNSQQMSTDNPIFGGLLG